MPNSSASSARSRSGPVMTTDEAAAYMKVTPRFIRRLVAERRITYLKVGRLVRFEPRHLDEFLARGLVEYECYR